MGVRGSPARAARSDGEVCAQEGRLRRQPVRRRSHWPGWQPLPACLLADDRGRDLALFTRRGRRVRRLASVVGLTIIVTASGAVLAGCGSGHAVSLGAAPVRVPSTAENTGTGSGAGTRVTPGSVSYEVWFAGPGGTLAPALRTHPATPRVATAALRSLAAGPTAGERAAGLVSAMPAATRLLGISITDGVATVDLTSAYESGGNARSLQLRLAQVVYTLTQFPTVRAVRFQLDGSPVSVVSGTGAAAARPVGRADYRQLAPQAVRGAWQRLPSAPVFLGGSAGVWAGNELVVVGRPRSASRAGQAAAAASYSPSSSSWRRLPPPPHGVLSGRPAVVWTGKEVVALGPTAAAALDPATGRWRSLPRPPPASTSPVVAWTGREVIACCNRAAGASYSPSTDEWSQLPPAPLVPVAGAWTGSELVVFDRHGSAAAYQPGQRTWKPIAPLPTPRSGVSVVWDGHEVLVVGGSDGAGPLPALGFAYDPAGNRWRALPPMESGRRDAAAVWTGTRLLLWGGLTGRPGALAIPPHGLAYDPATNRWSPLPRAPLLGRIGPEAAWTGRAMIVWGGVSGDRSRALNDGAAFAPAP
ncbi:MAG: hypothetical protein C5B48_09615 [Candidatus Rokuibacteriota bacterium]|nr:MAG: hypothetical protein C5B48_09615 [Candidatus Rokubacteria bacterium]